MFLLEEAIKAVLTADAGVSALAGNRVYCGFASQTTDWPALVFWILNDGTTDETLDPEERAHSGAATYSLRFASQAKGVGNYLAARRLDETLRLALHGFMGEVSSGLSPPEFLTIQGAFTRNLVYRYDPDTTIHSLVRDFDVIASESRPTPL